MQIWQHALWPTLPFLKEHVYWAHNVLYVTPVRWEVVHTKFPWEIVVRKKLTSNQSKPIFNSSRQKKKNVFVIGLKFCNYYYLQNTGMLSQVISSQQFSNSQTNHTNCTQVGARQFWGNDTSNVTKLCATIWRMLQIMEPILSTGSQL